MATQKVTKIRREVNNEMQLSTTPIAHASSAPGIVPGGLPETGEFDFFNYLLGLQATETDSPDPKVPSLLGGMQGKGLSSKKGAEEPLRSDAMQRFLFLCPFLFLVSFSVPLPRHAPQAISP